MHPNNTPIAEAGNSPVWALSVVLRRCRRQFQPRRSPMNKLLIAVALAFVGTLLVNPFNSRNAAVAQYPKPSIYPVSWELKFTHGLPKRIVVEVPGSSTPQAFWY